MGLGKICRAITWVLLASFWAQLVMAAPTDSFLGQGQGGGASEYTLGNSSGLLIHVNVIGGVHRAGIYHLPVSTDVLQLIGASGGLTDYAKAGDVKIKRRKGDHYELINIDVSDEMNSEKLSPKLENGDVVLIPESHADFVRDTSTILALTASIFSIVLSAYAISQLKK